MTLAQAVEYVAFVENYPATSERENHSTAMTEDESLSIAWTGTQLISTPSPMEAALNQVRAALQDDEIPIKWAQDRWPQSHTFFPNERFARDEPPRGVFWGSAEIDPSDDYSVSDQMPFALSGGVASERAVGNRKMRQLLLLCAKVYELWPTKEGDRVPSRSSPMAAPDKKYKAVIPDENVIRNEVRELYGRSTPKPNMAQAEQSIRASIPGATRNMIRTVLKEDEFAKQRRSAGNSRPRRR